jgi:hypothetical protein
LSLGVSLNLMHTGHTLGETVRLYVGLQEGHTAPRKLNNVLTDRRIQSIKIDGKYSDGNGLSLLVKGGRRSWQFTWTVQGKRTVLGPGSQRTVTLAQARDKARRCWEAIALDRDPRMVLIENEGVPSFGKAVEAYLEAKASGWRNDKHRAQWAMTLRDYAKPLHPRRVDQIATSDVLAVLKPHWQERPETAQRLQGRIARAWMPPSPRMG